MKKSWTSDSHNILEQATDLDNYNHWLIRQFEKHFGKIVLEVGSGLGGLSAILPKRDITLSDVRDDYFSFLNKEFGYKTLKLNIEKEAPKKYQSHFDTIFSSNVFEHIEDDQFAFNNCYQLLKSKGKLLLFVPACPQIYGSLDDNMGHFRRYTLEEGIIKAKKAGFKIIEAKYVNLPGYFAWWGRGVLLEKLIKSKPGKSDADSLLAKIYDFLIVPLLWFEKFYKPPVGQSLLLVAQKPSKK